jgi:BASS family bile acid:Na+ symporter
MDIYRTIQAVLAWLGNLGTRAIAALVVIGIAFPGVGQFLKPYVTEAVFILLCTAFMRVNITAVRSCLRRPGLVLTATAWTSIIIPCLIGSFSLLLGVNNNAPELYIALMLQAMASPIMSAPAFATIMGLDDTLVLVVLVFSTCLIPFTAPLFALVFIGPALSITPMMLAGKLFLILFGAAALGLGIRHVVGLETIETHGRAIDGFNIVILFVFVAAVMESVGPRMLADTMTTLVYTTLAFIVFFGVLALSTAAFIRAGQERALSIGLMVSQRNMGLMLAATGGLLPDLAWLYFALAQFPIFLSPYMLHALVQRLIQQKQVR